MTDRACAVTTAPLAAADIAALAALARRVWQATYPGLISQAQIDFMLADRYAPARIAAGLADPGARWLAAHQAGSLIGFAHVTRGQDASAKLDKCYVAPEFHGSGVGHALFDAAAAWARAQGATRLRLQVNRGNARAVRAYQKWGCVVVEARVFDIGEGFVMDDYVMEAAL